MSGATALVLGATGLTGSLVLRELLDDAYWEKVTVLARRGPALNAESPDRLDVRLCELDAMRDHADVFGVDAVFCCLGTTRARAGSAEAFRRVDHDYCIEAGRLARGQGAGHFLLVSAVNAKAESPLLYPRTKGETERALEALDFPALTIARPSLLHGPRNESRYLESLGLGAMKLATPLFRRMRSKWMPVEASVVARALVQAAREDSPPRVRRLWYRELHELAEQTGKQ